VRPASVPGAKHPKVATKVLAGGFSCKAEAGRSEATEEPGAGAEGGRAGLKTLHATLCQPVN
jgi:hypothetical protein